MAACPDLQTAVLGCTHYPLLIPSFRHALPKTVGILSQGDVVAASLEHYLHRHPEIRTRLDQTGTSLFYTSGPPGFSSLATRFLGTDVSFIHS